MPNRSSCSEPTERHNDIQFVSIIVKAATIRFKSTWATKRKVASTRPTSDKRIINELNQLLVKKLPIFIKPTTPNLTKKPLRKMENSVDASTCALSNQDENGHIGIFIIKPIDANIRLRVAKGSEGDNIGEKAAKISDMTRQKLPNIAQTYISTKASTLRSYLLCNFKSESALIVINSKQKTRINKELAHKRPRLEHRIISSKLPSKAELWRVDEAIAVIKTAEDHAAAKKKGRY